MTDIAAAPASIDEELSTIAQTIPAALRETRRSALGATIDRGTARLAQAASKRASFGTIHVTGAESFTIGDGDPVVQVTVNDPRAYTQILRNSSIGLGEGYIAQWWETDDLTTLLRIVRKNLESGLQKLDRAVDVVSGPLSAFHRLRTPTQRHDRRNVRAHYDLPGQLFDAMLDESMMYSCGVFPTPETSLGDAQRIKLEMICDKLALNSDDHVLEIGTGWGGFAIHAATTRGCRVTTTTVSVEQAKIARARVEAAGVGDRVEVLEMDYRDLTGRYSKLVSIEMIEAVDWRLYEKFFAVLEERLEPDGLMVLQAITIADRSYERAKMREDFIRALVFPGGCLPSVSALSRAMRKAGSLSIVGIEDIGEHYATTLRLWRARFDARFEDLAPVGYGPEFRRLWEFYLSYCEAAFLDRHISDIQMVIAGPRYKVGAFPPPHGT